MGFRKKKKVEEEVIEEVKEEEAVEEVEDEILPLDEDETPDDSKETGDIEDIKEEAPKAETDIRVGNKVLITVPRDYDGRPITVDGFSFYTVYAIEGDKVQLRGQFGRILFVKLSSIKKIK